MNGLLGSIRRIKPWERVFDMPRCKLTRPESWWVQSAQLIELAGEMDKILFRCQNLSPLKIRIDNLTYGTCARDSCHNSGANELFSFAGEGLGARYYWSDNVRGVVGATQSYQKH